MKVYLNNITGIDDAIISMYMSKRSWTKEIDSDVRFMVDHNITKEGFLIKDIDLAFKKELDKIIKYGVDYGHTTLLRFIDISFVVDGLHRAGQDDWDAHVKRMDNRIVRSSTRLASFSEGEKSDYYKDRILYPFEILDELNIDIPEKVVAKGNTYIKTDFGYVREEFKDDQDSKRGLYPLAIPSSFIFKVQYPELAHIYQHRNNEGSANPEVKELAEACRDLLSDKFKILADNLTKIKMQK